VVGRGVNVAFHASQPPNHERVAQSAGIDERLRPDVANFEDERHAEVAGEVAAGVADHERGARGVDHVGAVQLFANGGSQPGEALEFAHPAVAAHAGAFV